MALIELKAPPAQTLQSTDQDGVQDTYLDLTTGISGHMPPRGELPVRSLWQSRLTNLPGHKHDAILGTGVDSLQLRIAIPAEQKFDRVTYDTAKSLEDKKEFESRRINKWSIAAKTVMVIQIDTTPARYFKAFVRATPHHTAGNPAFASNQTTLEFEELVEGRIIWPLVVSLVNDTITVMNTEMQQKTVGRDDKELLFTLRPERDVESPEGPGRVPTEAQPSATLSPAEDMFNNPFPIARILFEEKPHKGSAVGQRRIVRPKWIENVEINAHFSKSYIDSTYLLRLNDAGRPETESCPDAYKFTVFITDRAKSIEEWDPTVVVEPQ